MIQVSFIFSLSKFVLIICFSRAVKYKRNIVITRTEFTENNKNTQTKSAQSFFVQRLYNFNFLRFTEIRQVAQ